jgi:SPP1 gp7 family putative phage head morphogenesis protein
VVVGLASVSVLGTTSARAALLMAIKRVDKTKRLQPLRPNVGLKIAYQKKIDRLIDEMQASVSWHLKAAYRANPPILAMDDILPANALKRAIALLKKRWLRRFDWAAPKLADYFALAVHKRTDKALASILRKGGFSVKFQQTQAMKDVVAATTAENVALIKSIPQKYLADVEVHVMQSISAGRDLGTLAKHLEKTYGITKRRAALISRDQNSKATSSMQRVRHLELGITKATWRHSSAGRQPRPTHVAMNGKTYDIAKGMWDSAINDWTQPGVQINCRCISVPIVPGFS